MTVARWTPSVPRRRGLSRGLSASERPTCCGWVGCRLGLSASAPPPQGMGELTRGPRERGAAALHTDPSRVGSISHVAFLLGFGTGARCGGVSLSRVPISSFCARLSRFRLARRSLCARVHVVGGAGRKPPLSDPASPPPLAVHTSTRPGAFPDRGGLRAGPPLATPPFAPPRMPTPRPRRGHVSLPRLA